MRSIQRTPGAFSRQAILLCGVLSLRLASAGVLPATAETMLPPGATNALTVLTSGRLLAAGSTLACLDPDTLELRWSRSLENEAPATCAAALPGNRFLTASRRQVRVHSADGTVEDTWADLGELAWTTSLAVGRDTVFVCDAGQRAVWRFSLDGRLLGRLPATVGQDEEAETSRRFSVPSPYFDAVHQDGIFHVVNPGGHEIRRYSPDGTPLPGSWGFASMLDPGGFAGCCNPIHLAMTASGGFVTAEKGYARIKLYDPDGKFRSIVVPPESFARNRVVSDLAVGHDGRIYVLDGQRLRVFALPPDGDVP